MWIGHFWRGWVYLRSLALFALPELFLFPDWTQLVKVPARSTDSCVVTQGSGSLACCVGRSFAMIFSFLSWQTFGLTLTVLSVLSSLCVFLVCCLQQWTTGAVGLQSLLPFSGGNTLIPGKLGTVTSMRSQSNAKLLEFLPFSNAEVGLYATLLCGEMKRAKIWGVRFVMFFLWLRILVFFVKVNPPLTQKRQDNKSGKPSDFIEKFLTCTNLRWRDYFIV